MERATQTTEDNIERLDEWRERKEAGPLEAETFLSGHELPCHEESISGLDDEMVLHEIIATISEEESLVNQIEDDSERNQSRYKMRHLGYLREVARRRLLQVELRVV